MIEFIDVVDPTLREAEEIAKLKKLPKPEIVKFLINERRLAQSYLKQAMRAESTLRVLQASEVISKEQIECANNLIWSKR